MKLFTDGSQIMPREDREAAEHVLLAFQHTGEDQSDAPAREPILS